MAIPGDILNRYVTPEQDFGGLYNLSDKIEKRRFREEQLAEREGARSAATGKFLADYLDPKDFLTGTYYDPQIVQGLNDLLVEGAELSRKGADPNMLMMALAPKVNRLSQYSTKAKLLNENLKKQLGYFKPQMGYDIPKLEQEARRTAFFGADGKLKDIDTVDPETDWVSETIKVSPEKVTTDVGIDEFVKNSPKFVNTKDVTRYTPKGGMERSKVKITSPNWLIPDTDDKGAMTELVPRYQIAIDGGNPVMHEFTNEKGQKVQAPVRVLDEGDFKSIMSSNPGIADWVRGQVRLANPDIDLNSPQATNAARAILYDELKRRRPGGIEDVEITKPPQVRNVTNINMPGSGSEINDAYSRIRGKVTEITQFGEPTTPIELLNVDDQNLVDELVNKGKSQDNRIPKEELHLQDMNGQIVVRQGRNGEVLGRLPRVGTNLKAQPGIKEKRTVIGQGEVAQQNKTTPSKMVTMVLPDGRTGQIPEDKVSQFLKDNPKAKRQ